MSELKKVPGSCPRCGSPPAVRVRVSGNATVTLNLRCEWCYRAGVEVYFDVRIGEREEAA